MRSRIVGSNGQQVLLLTSGISAYCYNGFSLPDPALDPKELAANMLQAMNANVGNNISFLDQQAVIATTNGIPLRTVSISTVNAQLLAIYQKQLQDQSPN